MCNHFHGYVRHVWDFADPGLNYAEYQKVRCCNVDRVVVNLFSINYSSNILMDAYFIAKLGDFGFARPHPQLLEGKSFVLHVAQMAI